MVEPIQGEGGVVVPRPDYLRGLRALADRRDLLLIFDEIQTGMGRTGTLFAYEQAGVAPDVMTLAKALGGGVPIGALCTTERVAAAFTPGSHGTTFGGNPLACAAAVAALRTIAEPDLLAHVRTVGRRLRDGLERARRSAIGAFAQVRGRGPACWAPSSTARAATSSRAASRDGLLINCTAERVLRLTPPLIVTRGRGRRGAGHPRPRARGAHEARPPAHRRSRRAPRSRPSSISRRG